MSLVLIRLRHPLLLCGIFSLALAHSATANLIVNPSFELVGANKAASTFTKDYKAIAANTLTGWTSSIGNATGAATYLSANGSTANWIPDATLGSYCVQLDSSTDTSAYSIGNSLSQNIVLTANLPYHLTFYMSAEAARGQPTTSNLDVILNGDGFSNFTTAFSASRTGTDTKATTAQWVLQTLDFTPTVSGTLTLTFQDIFVNNGTSSNASLDNLDLVQAVPELSHWSFYVSFLFLVVGLHHLHRRKASV